MSSPMTCLVRVGHKPHKLNRRKYGAPYIAIYWAGRRFVKPGVYVWVWKRHWRVLPWSYSK